MLLYEDSSYWFSEGTGGSKIYAAQADATAYFDFLDKVNKQEYETQPDYYSLNVMGLSETFALDLNTKQPFSLDNPATTITTIGSVGAEGISGFTVKDESGTTYTFMAVDETRVIKTASTGTHFQYGQQVHYISSWYLTRIVSPTGKDTYDFSYAAYAADRNENYAEGISEAVTTLANDYEDRSTTIQHSTTTTTYHNRKLLDKIVHNGKVIVDATHTDHILSGPDSGISRIDIFNDGSTTAGTSLSKSYRFNYSYFKTAALINPATTGNETKVRLKLDGIDILRSSGTSPEQEYEFYYKDPDNIAELGSLAQDYLGYYNGATTNTKLYPPSSTYSFPSSGEGGNRSPNFSASDNGILERIIYPTGGSSVFEYEQAKTRSADASTVSNYVQKATITHNPSSLPPFFSGQCNLQAQSGDISPSVATTTFAVNNGEDGLHYLDYTKTGTATGSTGLAEIGKQIVLVSLPDATTTYSWSQIYDSNCQSLINSNQIIWMYDGNDTSQQAFLFLNEGHYQLFVLSYRLGYTKTATITGPELSTVINYIETPKAGLRIKSIKDYASSSQLAKEKQYTYLLGRTITNPEFEYTTLETFPNAAASQDANSDALPDDYLMLHRATQPINNNGQHMAYPSVKESIVNYLNPSESLDKYYRFLTPNASEGLYKQGTYQIRQAGGSMGSTNYSKYPYFGSVTRESNAISSKEITYNSPLPHNNNRTFGLATHSIGRNSNKYPVIAQHPSGTGWHITLNDVPSNVGAISFVGEHLYFWVAPPECSSNQNYCSPEFARLSMHKTNAWGNYGGDPSLEKNTQDGLVQEVTYEYTSGNYRYPKTITTYDSKGDTLVTTHTYPHEDPTYTGLVNAHMFNIPVISTQSENSQLLSTTKTTYTTQELPDQIFTAKGSNSLESRMQFEQYLNKNVVQASQADGTPVSFIWGYDDRYVVARIYNATYNSLPTTTVNNIRSHSNAQSETALRNALAGLQNSLPPEAQMTYYTYYPNIGVRSMTDPSGYRMRYIYDNFQRLKKVLDADGKVVEKYDYNYRDLVPPGGSDPDPDPQPMSSSAVTFVPNNTTPGNTVYFTGQLGGFTGGKAPYTYQWYRKVVKFGETAGNFVSFATTSSNSFSFQYDITDATYCSASGGTIQFKCIVTDADGNTHQNLSTTTSLYCTIDQQ